MYVLGLMREKFWVVKGNAAVRRMLGKCIKCRRVHGRVIEQQMANLPPDRVESGKPPFYRTGVDLFGPFFVKRGRAQIKHWGVIFTCLSMRAIHLEVASNLTSDSFISAFRRFLARRGHVRTIRCDCGTNFVGSRKVLDSSYEFLGENKCEMELLQCGVELFSIPRAPHILEGAWERLIVEATVNSRPLTIVTSDSRDPAPLTPNKLLNMGESPAGCHVATGSYSKQRWKQVQHMAEQFWARWKREYLSGLQQRQKWFKERRNVRERCYAGSGDTDVSLGTPSPGHQPPTPPPSKLSATLSLGVAADRDGVPIRFSRQVRITNGEELEEVSSYFRGVGGEFYDSSIKKMVHRMQEYIDLNGDYVKK
ncbi:uncharacterized protein LOC135222369 [Macrobrachium nipponense]|uniref:uncharacterized protein LOC135222369 n=1 Tax=Macrobrachium nipponense TaxID=159736 RepID=UPI0030C8C1F2